MTDAVKPNDLTPEQAATLVKETTGKSTREALETSIRLLREFAKEDLYPCAWQCASCHINFILDEIKPTQAPKKCLCGSTDIRISQWTETKPN